MKKRITALLLAAALTFCALLALSSCKKEDKITPRQALLSLDFFDTVSYVYDYSGSSEEEFNATVSSLKERLEELGKLYDIYESYDGITNVKDINDRAGEGPVKVDKDIIDLLIYAKEIYGKTDGQCNIALGAVLKIWHEHRTAGRENPDTATLPDMQELLAAREHTDINDVIINEAEGTVEITDAELSLDVGAVAKGYACEIIAQELEAEGKRGYVLDLGGNLRAVGTKKDGSGWKTGIKNPDTTAQNRYVYYHELKNEAIATSGDYERFYTVGGIRYHHIINLETLMPESYYRSVSVISPNAALSDALSTAIFNMPKGEAEAFVKASPDALLVVLVLQNGEVKTLKNN